MKRRRFLTLAAAGPLLAACQPLAVRPDDTPLGPAPARFVLTGRLSLRQGSRQDHLGFDWERAPGRDRILLLGPLGQGLAELVRDERGAQLVRPGAPDETAPSLEELSLRIFGTALPLGELGDWLRGARGVSGEVDGWRVAVVDVSPSGPRRLPRRLQVARDDIVLVLLADDWQAMEDAP